MSKRNLLLSLSFSCACLFTTSALAGGADALRAFFADVKTLRADFEQTLFDAQQNAVQTAKGTLALSRPGKFRWDYAEPYQQVMVGDGERVWLYDPELEQVTVKPQQATLGASPATLLSGTRPLDEAYFINDLGTRDGAEWVELKPRDAEADFTTIRLALGQAGIETMELIDSFGQTTRIVFNKVARNPALDAAQFQFTPPPGADVIGAAE